MRINFCVGNVKIELNGYQALDLILKKLLTIHTQTINTLLKKRMAK